MQLQGYPGIPEGIPPMTDHPAPIHPALYWSDTVLFIKMCAKQQ